jgi:hypothetical protein
MSRDIHSLDELWREYNEGVAGGPSIRSLEIDHGTKWRSSVRERKYYSERKPLFDIFDLLSKEVNIHAVSFTLKI